jgi:MFS family permease
VYEKEPSFLISARFLLSFMLFLGIGLIYLQRMNMSIQIVCMADNANSSLSTTNNTKINSFGKFDWSKSMQGFILSAYYYGYLLTQTPSAWLCFKYGPKVVMGVGILGSSLTTILSAPAAQLSVYLLITLRVLTGMFHVTKKF